MLVQVCRGQNRYLTLQLRCELALKIVFICPYLHHKGAVRFHRQHCCRNDPNLCCRDQPSYLSLRARCELALKIVSGLSYLHLKGVVHFDLKPDNLLLDTRSTDDDAETPDLKMADFGLAKIKWQQYVSGVQDLR